jgi:phosphatidylglycerol:prolipoprotein diacylglycerol transferase
MNPSSHSPSTAYGWLMLAGIGVSLWFWLRLARRDSRLLAVYVGGLLGAFLGAKVLYLAIDGWRYIGQPDVWLQLATGKTILGALLGGYLAVELVKRVVGYRGITGDWFALIAPVGITLGRLGCLVHGCCHGQACAPAYYTLRDAAGVDRWPAVPAEILFNLAMVALFLVLRWRRKLAGQHFQLYLIAYGTFRFLHEFLRNEHRLLGPITGYQLAALAVAGFGLVAFVRRWRADKVSGAASPSAASVSERKVKG